MAIDPPSDIVLDVIRAADPAASRGAAERLAKLSGGAAPDGAGFEAELERRTPVPGPRLPFDPAAASVAMRSATSLGAPDSPLQRFEAFVLQSFIEAMLPKEGTAIYGEGTSGEIWKSMLAESLAGELARAGGIGIADSLAVEDDAVGRPEPGA